MSLLGHTQAETGKDIGVIAEIDASSHALKTITVAHAKIHSGGSDLARAWLDSIAIGEYPAIGFMTPPVEIAHATVDWISEAEAQIDVLEAPVNTPGANPVIVAYNRNRNSPNLSGFTNLRLYDNVGVAGGTSIDFDYTWTRKQAGGGGGRGTMEIQLRSSTVYAIMFTAIAVGGGLLKLNWYEREDMD